MLEGLVTGKANKVIAYDLGISPRTVEIYRANLMTKMSANSLSDLVRMAMTAGRSLPSACQLVLTSDPGPTASRKPPQEIANVSNTYASNGCLFRIATARFALSKDRSADDPPKRHEAAPPRSQSV